MVNGVFGLHGPPVARHAAIGGPEPDEEHAQTLPLLMGGYVGVEGGKRKHVTAQHGTLHVQDLFLLEE